jgi:4-amino-4-deoxy-L-arabinose transferase-like glycosyltransferase
MLKGAVRMNSKCWFFLLVLVGLGVILLLSIMSLKLANPPNVSFNASYTGYYYAQVARNLVRGHGFATDLIFPVAIHKFGMTAEQPDCLCPPLQTLFLGLAFCIFGFRDWVILLPSYLFYLSAIAATFYLGLKVFDLKTAVLSSLLLLINLNLVLSIVGEGNERPLALFIFVLLLVSLYNYDYRSFSKAFLPGVLLGFGYLTMYSFVLFLPPVCWYVYKMSGEARRRAVCTCLVSFGVLALPWLIRNFVVAGNPFFTYAWIDKLHGSAMSNLFVIGGKGIFGGPGGIKSLLSRTYAELYAWFFVTGDFMGILFIVSIFYKFEDEKLRRLRRTVYIMILLFIGRRLFYDVWHPYLIFYPFIIVMGVACFLRLLRDFAATNHRIRVAAICILILINSVPLLRIYWQAGGNPYYRGRWRPILAKLGPKRPLASDGAHVLTWYEDRKVIALPINEESWKIMVQKIGQEPALLMTEDFYDLFPVLIGREPSAVYTAAGEHDLQEPFQFGKALSWEGNVLLY